MSQVEVDEREVQAKLGEIQVDIPEFTHNLKRKPSFKIAPFLNMSGSYFSQAFLLCDCCLP
jgi:hypothetical protein